MGLPTVDLANYHPRLRPLVWGSWDSWNNLLAVIQDLSEEQLDYHHPGIGQLDERYQETTLGNTDTFNSLQNKISEYFQKTSEICFLRGLGGFPTKAMG